MEVIDEFYLVDTKDRSICVSLATAKEITKGLQDPTAGFIQFLGLYGGTWLVRSNNILNISESTPELREVTRLHNKMIDDETAAFAKNNPQPTDWSSE